MRIRTRMKVKVKVDTCSLHICVVCIIFPGMIGDEVNFFHLDKASSESGSTGFLRLYDGMA